MGTRWGWDHPGWGGALDGDGFTQRTQRGECGHLRGMAPLRGLGGGRGGRSGHLRGMGSLRGLRGGEGGHFRGMGSLRGCVLEGDGFTQEGDQPSLHIVKHVADD